MFFKNALFTNKLWEFVVRFQHSTAVPNIVYISLFLSELEERVSSHCSLLWYTKGIVYQQNYHMIGAEPLKSTCLQSFVHVCIQVIELQELACRIVMIGRSCFFLWFYKKGDVDTNFTMPIFCVSPKSITSPSLKCWSILISEICEFNRKKEKKKKKMNNSKVAIVPFP